MGDRREQLVNGEGIVIGLCNSRRLAQHMIRRRDEKMAMVMSGNTNAPGTTLLQHLNGGGGI